MEESKVARATKTQLPPCCLKIVHDKYVLVGSYHLDKPSGIRTGALDIFDIDLELKESYSTYGAILDLKLSPFDSNIVATAHSTGNVTLWKIVFTDDHLAIKLEQLNNLQVFDQETLITSLHFSPMNSQILLLTTTQGTSATLDLISEDVTFSWEAVTDRFSQTEKVTLSVQGKNETVLKVEPTEFVGQHNLECWTGEFGQLQPLQNVVFTGGDDATIIAHDLRSKETIWSNSRIHEAGVVAIKTSSESFRNSSATSIITGSYDDKIRALDLRMLGDTIYPGQNTPVAKIWDCNLGGGVWRFSEMPLNLSNSASSNVDKLLVCCMYDGAKVIEINDISVKKFQITNYLKTGHESMCYGGDWCSEFIVTCSFYDNSLQLWNP